MKRSRRRNFEEEHEEQIPESWLLPYADILTLLLALFIVLFASGQIDNEKYQNIMETFQSEFAGISMPSNPEEPQLVPELPDEILPGMDDPDEIDEDKELDKLRLKMEYYIVDNDLQDLVTLGNTRRGIEIALKDVILFDSGRAELKEESFETLNTIIGIVESIPNQISIEGHTDNVPIVNAPFGSNWELSAARALSVLEYFESQNIPKERLGFTGFGEHKPVSPNDTEEQRQENRRVNIIILRDNQGVE